MSYNPQQMMQRQQSQNPMFGSVPSGVNPSMGRTPMPQKPPYMGPPPQMGPMPQMPSSGIPFDAFQQQMDMQLQQGQGPSSMGPYQRLPPVTPTLAPGGYAPPTAGYAPPTASAPNPMSMFGGPAPASVDPQILQRLFAMLMPSPAGY